MIHNNVDKLHIITNIHILKWNQVPTLSLMRRAEEHDMDCANKEINCSKYDTEPVL